MITQDRLNFLMDAYAQRNISRADYAELMLLLKDPVYKDVLGLAMDQVFEEIQPEDMHTEEELDVIYNRILIDARFDQKARTTLLLRKWKLAVAAAVATVIFGVGLFYFNHLEETPAVLTKSKEYKIVPGGNKATLTLASGKVIGLSDAKSGVIIDGTKVTYEDGSLLQGGGQAIASVAQLITASTPRGGTYEFVLPDGSHVWLNAATTLKFPSTFSGSSNRTVELKSGEAYFEIAKDSAHPFIVKSPGQEIEVLGTHFNINAYLEEDALRTTLLEGAVKINQNVFLNPGQQALLKNEKIQVLNADIEAAMAWKNGEFIFNPDSFESTMNMIARWYDVEIIYDYKPVGLRLSGQVSRRRSITEVLNRLQEIDGVKFKVEGRRIRVIK
ncbi:FecR family protein [Pedobacter sp. GR22-6]|uniref:FecR family protein n=1 Tax=Pedobacter sp. GR22-6 TaxID=3127957 RepID=UPI00307F84DB